MGIRGRRIVVRRVPTAGRPARTGISETLGPNTIARGQAIPGRQGIRDTHAIPGSSVTTGGRTPITIATRDGPVGADSTVIHARRGIHRSNGTHRGVTHGNATLARTAIARTHAGRPRVTAAPKIADASHTTLHRAVTGTPGRLA